MKNLQPQVKERFIAYTQILLGCLIGAAAYPAFLVPNDIAPGGLTGVATILHYLFHFPVGTVSLILNVPLFLIGYRTMGKVFTFRTLIATLLFSLLIDWIPLQPFTADPLLASLFGGVLLGIGLGLILRGGATSGGTDLVARMVHNRFPHISTGMFLFAIDFMVVISAGSFIQIEYALYALIAIFLSSYVLDKVVQGLNRQKACYIISEQHQAIQAQLLTVLNRGVTIFDATGAYSGKERPVLLCIVSAAEVAPLKAVVTSYDAKAFVYITDAYEVLGEGFSRLNDAS